jgi:transposase
MHKTNSSKGIWKRHKKVTIPWADYDKSRIGECGRILDLRRHFTNMDRRVQRREFKLSGLVILLFMKCLLNVPYRTLCSMSGTFRLWSALGFKRNPSYKTIQRTLGYLDEGSLRKVNRSFIPKKARLWGIDSSGMKTTRKGAWLVIRFDRKMRKRDFKKVHVFVDLESKKILSVVLTGGTVSDGTQMEKMLKMCRWVKIQIILGDGGYDSRECFNAIEKRKAVPGIKVRKNSVAKTKGCPARKQAVVEQKKDFEKWKESVEYRMRCVVESIFSAMKRRFGEIVHSINEGFRKTEVWLRVILWNVCIYPR